MSQLKTSKERISDLENNLNFLSKEIGELRMLIESYIINPKSQITNALKQNFPKLDCVGPTDGMGKSNSMLLREPIMYLYNMTGQMQNITIDFKDMKLPDSIPEIRSDGKLNFNLDSDSFINSKYKYLYYEIEYDKELPKGVQTIYISNDKFLAEGLTNLAILCGLWSDEVTDFVGYWDLELKRSDCKYWKCEILTEKELDIILPIEIYPKPDFFIRRYVKFSESDKAPKINSKLSKDLRIPTAQRSGKIRVSEFGGTILLNSEANEKTESTIIL